MSIISALLRYASARLSNSKLPLKAAGEVQSVYCSGELRTNWQPSVSIIVPTRDRAELLQNCIESIIERTDYRNYELLVVDNGSTEEATATYLQRLVARGHKVLRFDEKFNYSKICNFGIAHATGEVICLLNNDTEVTSATWLNRLVNHLESEKVGLVGSFLLYPDGTVQHGGLVLGYRGVAGYPGRAEPLTDIVIGCNRVSAVTFACVAFRSELAAAIGPLDEKLAVGLNDVDYSIRSHLLGKSNIVCSKSRLIHLESASRNKMSSFIGAADATRDILAFLNKYPRWHDFEIRNRK